MISFSELGLAEPIVRALTEERHITPTPIQAEAIPHVLSGRDLIGIAQTGTGKTAAFALPILDRLARHPARPLPKTAKVLILSPTRELSGQIQENFTRFGRHLRLSVALAIGGVPMGRQIRALAPGVDVLVATPGRLMDLVENNALKLDQVSVFVLDEADQMLDMGFVHAIRAIVRRLPAKRHSLFFSATMPSAIAELAGSMLHNPVTVAVTPVAKTADKVEQRVMLVDKQSKPALLAELLAAEPIDRALVFTRTKHGADKVVRALEKAGLSAEAIHGNKSQNQRDRVLAAFRDGTVRTLVATDIAARGIDVTGVSHVFNFDLPNVAESYVHRIGRTARAGREGIAISFCDSEERAFLKAIERLIRMQLPLIDRRAQAQAAPAPLPADPQGRSEPARPARRPEGGRSNQPGRSRDGRAQDGRGHEGRESRPHDARKPKDGRASTRNESNSAGAKAGRSGEGRGAPRQQDVRGGGMAASASGADIGAVGFMRTAPARGGQPDARVRRPR
ncbi:DEAD/DEAH box helicase [Aquabacter spiritensis]|uniref:ATP-dependent RNA helicase RhlE n=1 Tax=Aquabacter spiritensis TaxID=933073 RepID=A0A4R3LR13_9HYPH|nr:DEAD/DEAH box helicase [Aquabacter spiritensis]TCT02912.1 ATP-dependent RNA helicase RhlE [Aquabacter spiritensis]